MAAVRAAVSRALTVPADTALKLRVILSRKGTQRHLDAVAKRFDREPVDSQLLLVNLRPVITKEQDGRSLRRGAGDERDLHRAGDEHASRGRRSAVHRLKPSVIRGSFGPVIVIHRGSNRLDLYEGMRFQRVFGVATGQSAYPTPLGQLAHRRQVAEPWWFPPNSPWAKGEKPVPPGPGNPPARAGWASRPAASASTAPPRTRRSATRPRTAASGCTSRRRVALQPRDGRHDGLHRLRVR